MRGAEAIVGTELDLGVFAHDLGRQRPAERRRMLEQRVGVGAGLAVRSAALQQACEPLRWLTADRKREAHVG